MKNLQFICSIIVISIITGCSSTQTKSSKKLVSSDQTRKKSKIGKNINHNLPKNNNNKLKNWRDIDLDKLESNYFSDSNDQNEKTVNDRGSNENEVIPRSSDKIIKSELNTIKNNQDKLQLVSGQSGYSNPIRVKTVYEIANETKPSLFLPHDEFETAKEYKLRVTEQVKLMKEIVLMTSQKMEIRNAQRIQIAKEKEIKKIGLIQSLIAESSSSVEFTPNDIGRYSPEKETFPVVLHDVQYQISVPREEARSFKENFSKIKIRGLKQLKPKYDISISAKKAHIRSRPNGSIIGIASNGDIFEHVQDEDEWHKINYKGQFGFTHQNNAELKIVDIANEYEYLDLVAIHPTTGSLFTMISVDELVKAPLNLASRKIAESGDSDGPK